MTMDIETFVDKNNILQPYAIGFYKQNRREDAKINKQLFLFYLSDYQSVDDMLETCFNTLFKLNINNHVIYLHNFSGFDYKFLLDFLVNNYSVNLMSWNSKVLGLTVKHKNKTVHFRDSYLIFPQSLDSFYALIFYLKNKNLNFLINLLMS